MPASALSLPDGSGGGLQAEYRFSTATGTETVTQTDSQLDHAWFGTYPMRAKFPQLRARLIARLAALAIDPDYLASWSGLQPPQTGHALWQGPRLVELMDSAQQTACLRGLAARPDVLLGQGGLWTVDLFWGCRFGSPDTAVEFLGTWAQLHPDAEPSFGDAYDILHLRYRRLADAVMWQYPPHGQQLEEQYLVLPDGGCCLPLAYILAHGYREKGRLGQWIDKLEARLDALPAVGDVRVNWLIARAMAQEIRGGRPERGGLPLGRVLAGRGWLEEAMLAAQSEPLRLRVHKELAVRLADRGRLAEAAAVLQQAASKFTAPSSQEALALWQQQLAQLAVQLKEKSEVAEAQVQEAYVQQLRGRLQRAQQRDDSQAAARYEQLIQAAQGTDQ